MKVELARANQLVSSLQKKGGEVLHLSPAAAKASALLKSGMSLTEIYSKYVEVGITAVEEPLQATSLCTGVTSFYYRADPTYPNFIGLALVQAHLHFV